MSVRTTTAQELLENQDPDVLYMLDEVTKVVTPIEVPKAEQPKRRGKKEATDAAVEPAPEGEGE